MNLSPDDYEAIRRAVRDELGIELGTTRQAMVSRRLARLSNLGAVLAAVRSSDPPADVMAQLADVLTTNHTHWGREFAHYDVLAHWLARSRSPRIRLWCAASSTGEEPYTLWMTVDQSPAASHTSILATDISAPALETARRGVYAREDITRLPEAWQRRYFEPRPDDRVAVVERGREAILFRRLNLMTAPLPFRHKLDVIFCRNVVIYFEGDTRREVVQRMVDQLKPGGLFCIGLAETLPKGVVGLKRIGPSAFTKQ